MSDFLKIRAKAMSVRLYLKTGDYDSADRCARDIIAMSVYNEEREREERAELDAWFETLDAQHTAELASS